MEHRPSVSSKENGDQFPGPLRMYGNTYQIQHTTVPSFFSGPSASNCPSSQTPGPKSEHGNTHLSDLGSYMESFTSANLHSSADSTSQVCGPSPGLGRRPDLPQGMPPEALLDVISTAQCKLQHLEVLARMMIQGNRHHGMAQQQQSLSMEFASVMLQLYATMPNISLPAPFQALSPSATQVNDTFDFSFDGFNEDDLNITLGGGSFFPPPSKMDATSSEMCKGAGVHLSSAMMDSRATKVNTPVASTNEAPDVFALVSAHTNAPESNQSKGTRSTPLEIRKNSNVFTLVSAHTNAPESNQSKGTTSTPPEIGKNSNVHESEDLRDEDDEGEGESLPPGSYDLVELAATEILAEHTHFCEICSKGFKRDANLRMHMRGHGDEYKTAAALARPDKTPCDASVKLRRYSCPYAGCKRNTKHPKFQPLKTMLCVKNHYRRSHCPKLLICSRCKVKKFSVVADLKTHEKHCGQDKWQCSCGTTFSRKDKLYGHIGLFAGHTPATLGHKVESMPGLGDGMEVLAIGKASEAGMGGLLAMQDNVAANYVDVSQGMNSFNVSVMGMGVKQNDVSSQGQIVEFKEHRLKEREMSSFLTFDEGPLIREALFPSGSASRIVPDSLELQSLLSATEGGFFNQEQGMK